MAPVGRLRASAFRPSPPGSAGEEPASPAKRAQVSHLFWRTMIRVGIIGYGYWGPRIARNFHSLDGCELTAICDKSSDSLRRAQQAFPGVIATSDLKEVLCSPQIDAMAGTTPVWTHYQLAKAAMENGQHVFVDKP